jgi:hypothetical protein
MSSLYNSNGNNLLDFYLKSVITFHRVSCLPFVRWPLGIEQTKGKSRRRYFNEIGGITFK